VGRCERRSYWFRALLARYRRERLDLGHARCNAADGSICSRASEKPGWGRDTYKLLVGDIVVREYDRVAPHQFAVLDAFERAGWPPSVAAPLVVERISSGYSYPLDTEAMTTRFFSGPPKGY